MISIAHRLATVVDFDRIAVMRDGELIECGTPTELLQRDSELRAMAIKSTELELLLNTAGRSAGA